MEMYHRCDEEWDRKQRGNEYLHGKMMYPTLYLQGDVPKPPPTDQQWKTH